MSFQSERRAIESRFASMWAAISNVKVAYENVPFPPENFTEPDEFVTCQIITGDGDLLEIGSNPNARWVGVIQNVVHVRPGTGTDRARQLCDMVAEIWNLATFFAGQSGEIRCQISRMDELGEQETGFYAFAVSTSYQRTRPVQVPAQNGGLVPMGEKQQRHDPIGTRDGVNAHFTLNPTCDPLTGMFFLNGQLLISPQQYTIAVDGNSLDTVGWSPLADDAFTGYY